MNSRVLQIRTDALAAEYIYSKKLSVLGRFSVAITCLVILTPILTSVAILLAKGTRFEGAFNTISVILSTLLLALSVFALIIKLDSKRESYLISRRSNIYVSSEALKLIDQRDEELSWFFNYQAEMDSRDQENIGQVSAELRQEAYRYALMKQVPGDSSIVCAICHSSPFVFKDGSCQVCGNTPKE